MSRPALPAWSRVAAIADVPGLGAHSLASGVRWTWQPGAVADAKDRRDMRGMDMSFGAVIGIAVLVTTGAIRGCRSRKLPSAVTVLLTCCSPGGALMPAQQDESVLWGSSSQPSSLGGDDSIRVATPG